LIEKQGRRGEVNRKIKIFEKFKIFKNIGNKIILKR
jgi:hypothetical protein